MQLKEEKLFLFALLFWSVGVHNDRVEAAGRYRLEQGAGRPHLEWKAERVKCKQSLKTLRSTQMPQDVADSSHSSRN